MKKRLLSFDIYRIIVVFIVFSFHARGNIKTDFGILTDFFTIGNFAMIAFFMLSGALLFLSTSKRDLSKIDSIKRFYIRRISVVIPGYLILFVIWNVFSDQSTSVTNKVWVAVPQVLGIHSVYHNGQGYLPVNPGTWFISCLLICYLIFPFLQEITKQIKIKTKIILLIIFMALMAYSPWLAFHFNIESIYSNAFFAILQFFMGVLLVSLTEDVKMPKVLSSWIAFVVEWILLIAAITIAVRYVGIRDNSSLYNLVIIPIICLIILTSLGIGTLTKTKAMVFISEMTFELYLVQCVNLPWIGSDYICRLINLDGNIIRFLLSLIIGVLGAIILHLINKMFGRLIKRKII